jgi:peptidoglycan/LPS O-acetylase OafA/YrhL
MLYRVYQFDWGKNLAWSAFAIAAFGAAVGVSYLVEPVSLAPAPLLGLLVLALARVRGPIAWFFSSRVMIFLGEASYTLYMTHEVVRMYMFKVLGPNRFEHASLATRLGVIAIWITVIFGVMAFTFFLVETPAREVMRKIVGRRRKPVEQDPTSVHVPAEPAIAAPAV